MGPKGLDKIGTFLLLKICPILKVECLVSLSLIIKKKFKTCLKAKVLKSTWVIFFSIFDKGHFLGLSLLGSSLIYSLEFSDDQSKSHIGKDQEVSQ